MKKDSKKEAVLRRLEKQITEARTKIQSDLADLIRYQGAFETLSGFPVTESSCACMLKELERQRSEVKLINV